MFFGGEENLANGAVAYAVLIVCDWPFSAVGRPARASARPAPSLRSHAGFEGGLVMILRLLQALGLGGIERTGTGTRPSGFTRAHTARQCREQQQNDTPTLASHGTHCLPHIPRIAARRRSNTRAAARRILACAEVPR